MQLSMILSSIIMAIRLVPGIKLTNTVSIIYLEVGGKSTDLFVLFFQISMVLLSERKIRPWRGPGPSQRSTGGR